MTEKAVLLLSESHEAPRHVYEFFHGGFLSAVLSSQPLNNRNSKIQLDANSSIYRLEL